MQRRGMHFGSHTRSHRILHTLSAAELQMELAGSRDDLRRELGVTPVALAYPGGLPIARMAGVVRAIEGAGYRLGFTTLTGPGALAPTPDLLALGRMPVHRGLTPARFRGMLAVPEVFAASPV
jgi:peptidoglycan/xylan/chitin deacetylase (PgdA/CDA1 family)